MQAEDIICSLQQHKALNSLSLFSFFGPRIKFFLINKENAGIDDCKNGKETCVPYQKLLILLECNETNVWQIDQRLWHESKQSLSILEQTFEHIYGLPSSGNGIMGDKRPWSFNCGRHALEHWFIKYLFY